MQDYRTYKFSKKEEAIIFLSCMGLSALAGFLFYNTVLSIVIAPAIYLMIKNPLEKAIAERKRHKLRNQFRDVLYSFSSSFAAGAHMEEAMEIAALQISDIYGIKSEMSVELLAMIKKMKETAGSEEELWEDLAYRSGIEDIEDFARVFTAVRDAGGNLVQAVDRAATLIVDKINIENEMRTLFSQKKTEGRMVGIMPVAMILFLRITSPSYLDLMYDTLLGRMMMTGALMAMIYAIYMIEKITKIDV